MPRPPSRCFEVVARDGAARAGILRTARGDVPTPAFMPVGTRGSVRGIDPAVLRALGASIVLANAYHLHFRPGEEIVEALGGIQRFMAWDGPVLTDSGGFQVFSLRDTVRGLDEEGVTFRSIYDGEPARLTPEVAAEVQRRLGSDVAMCLDVCPPAGVGRPELERAVELTASGRAGSSRLPGPKGSSSSGSPRAAPIRSSAGARSRRSRSSGSTAMPSAG